MARFYGSILVLSLVLLLSVPTRTVSGEDGLDNGEGGASGAWTLNGGACSNIVQFKGKEYIFGNCLVLDPTGDFKLAWTWEQKTKKLNFCFLGVPESPYGWVAWGLSPQNAMIGSQVIVAYGNPDDTTYSMVNPYSISGKYSGAVVPSNAINAVNSSLEVEISNNGNLIDIHGTIADFDASKGLKSIIWQGGPGVVDYTAGLLQMHINIGTVAKLDFSGQEVYGVSAVESAASSIQSAKITHAWLAGLGFGAFLPLGILVARYFKAWADPAWFYAHIGLQLIGYILGVVGWGYGIYLKGQTGSLSGHPSYTQNHYAIGIIIFCTATLQILTPLGKPDKEAKLRFYWNITHWGLGYLTIILSITNVFLGFENLEHSLISYKTWETIYIVYIVLVGIVAVVLEVFAWRAYAKDGGMSGITMKPMRLQETTRQDESLNPYPASV